METLANNAESSIAPLFLTTNPTVVTCCDQIDTIIDMLELVNSIDNGRIVERRRAILAHHKLLTELIEQLVTITGELRHFIEK